MNDLHEKKENDFNGSETTGNSPHEESRLFYKKLGAYLLLLYQAYLQKETVLAPEIKAAYWRMVQFQEGFPTKIRMMQLEYLGFETDNLDCPWDAVKDSLFPIKDFELQDALTAERESQIQEYKKEIMDLLRSTG
ncbi:hypothetical protein [Maribacter halichondriae]|uniref:hypothetical protein n=1 Tax=Maribacter halichondriae TaxID=2980554 RepID=UPI0023591A30|nr:hypothetical protein [Maribacter sp. Hal144]